MEINLTVISFLAPFSCGFITLIVCSPFQLEGSVIIGGFSTFFFLILIKITITVIIIITPTTPATIPTIAPIDIDLDEFFL